MAKTAETEKTIVLQVIVLILLYWYTQFLKYISFYVVFRLTNLFLKLPISSSHLKDSGSKNITANRSYFVMLINRIP